MQLDIEDVLAGAVGSVVGRFLLFVAAVWLGCTIGGAALVAGAMAEAGFWRVSGDLWWLFTAPLFLISTWLLLNVPFLLICLMRFVRGEGDGYVTLGLVIGVESLVVMVGWAGDFAQGWLPRTVAWLAWLVLSIMIGTGIWLVRQHSINCWARELGALRAANAQRAAQREAEERERIYAEKEGGS